MQLTDNQAMYRAYLASPVWKAKRLEALAFYGCTCKRCGDHGTDVHHKTYRRVGGREKMRDLEILCRSCHEAHHATEKVTGRKTKRRGIHRRAIEHKLTSRHIEILFREFPKMSGNLHYELNFGNVEIAKRTAVLLGCDYAYGPGINFKYPPKCVIYHESNGMFTREFNKLSKMPKNLFDRR